MGVLINMLTAVSLFAIHRVLHSIWNRRDKVFKGPLNDNTRLNLLLHESKIPTPAEFAEANRLDDEETRGLQNVSNAVMQRFKSRCPLHSVYILYQVDVDFRAYVFFEKDKHIEACKKSGVVHDLIAFVYEELEREGRGKKDEFTVDFEFDSDQNVRANYEGSYYYRLL